jgi:hypothetical protein
MVALLTDLLGVDVHHRHARPFQQRVLVEVRGKGTPS